MKIPTARKMSSGNYFIQLRLGGESITVTAPTERECIRQAEYVKSEYLTGRRVAKPEEPPKFPTLGDAIDRYIENRSAVLSPSTVRGYRIIRRNSFQGLMDTSLSDITPAQFQQAVNIDAREYSGKTLKNAWGFLCSVIADATGAPAPTVKLPQVIPNEHPFLEPEQIPVFIKSVHGQPCEIPALLALHSLRRSEIMALKWENIDLENRIVKVSGAAVYNEDNVLKHKKENKNKSSARTVPILMDEPHAALSAAKKDTGFVMACNPNTIWAQINRICERNGLPQVGVHGLRHSFVSLAYHLGVPEKIVMELGGWSDYQTMRKIYTHIAKSDVTKYTGEFKKFFSPPAPSSPDSPENEKSPEQAGKFS